MNQNSGEINTKWLTSFAKDLLKLLNNNKKVLVKNNQGKKIIKKLFDVINNNPKKYLNNSQLKLNKQRTVADFISGMTDRYAINLYNKIK